MRRAAKIDANQETIVQALKTAGAAVLSLAPMGNGVPDLMVGHRGSKRIGLVEIKDGDKPPSKRRLTEDQIRFWDAWEGFPLAQVKDIEGALRFYKLLGTY